MTSWNDLLQSYMPLLDDLRAADQWLHAYIGDPLKWVGPPVLAAGTMARAAYGPKDERAAFLVVTLAVLACFAENLVVSHGLVTDGSAADLKISAVSNLLFVLFVIMFCWRPDWTKINVRETWTVVTAVVGTASLSVFLMKTYTFLSSLTWSLGGDEVMCAFALGTAGACFVAWASRFGATRTILVAAASSLLVIPQISWWSHNTPLLDMLRVSEVVLALLLTIGTFGGKDGGGFGPKDRLGVGGAVAF
jgi:hypothetical protein